MVEDPRSVWSVEAISEENDEWDRNDPSRWPGNELLEAALEHYVEEDEIVDEEDQEAPHGLRKTP